MKPKISKKMIKHKVRVGFDKLTAVIRIPKDMHREIERNMQQVIKQLTKKHELRFNELSSAKHGYIYNLTLPLSQELSYSHKKANLGKPKLYLQVRSVNGERPFIRFELSGFPLSEGDYFIARLWLERVLGSGASSILKANKIKVTRVDIAHDFTMKIDEFFINFKRSMKSQVFTDKNGMPETMYFSLKGAEFSLCVYSLTARRKKYKQLDVDGYASRSEVRFRANCYLSELCVDLLVGKYLNRIDIFDRALEDEAELSKLIRAHMIQHGIKPTLQLLEPKDRRKIRNVMKKYKINVINKGQVNASLQEELDRVKALTSEHKMAKSERVRFEKIFKSHLN